MVHRPALQTQPGKTLAESCGRGEVGAASHSFLAPKVDCKQLRCPRPGDLQPLAEVISTKVKEEKRGKGGK